MVTSILSKFYSATNKQIGDQMMTCWNKLSRYVYSVNRTATKKFLARHVHVLVRLRAFCRVGAFATSPYKQFWSCEVAMANPTKTFSNVQHVVLYAIIPNNLKNNQYINVFSQHKCRE